MMDRLQYEIEISGSAATLYLAGRMETTDVPFLRVLCATLPSFVRMLRVDLLAVRSPSPHVTVAVREILHAWRSQRRGEFQLSIRSSHLATTSHGHADDRAIAAVGGAPCNRDALMATYL
jgi:hypothetical protein